MWMLYYREMEIVRFLKKNPNEFSSTVLQDLLLLEGEYTTPLMETINAEERQMRLHRPTDDCHFCQASGIGVKLSKWTCKMNSYCGRERQKRNWADHKKSCKEVQRVSDALRASAEANPKDSEATLLMAEYKCLRRWLQLLLPTVV